MLRPTFSQILTHQEAFETAAQINEELKRTKFDDAFCEKFKLIMRKSVEEMIHQKRNKIIEGPRI